ncbi:MAG: hypothetical protein QNJ78_09210 [Gammaproteobacteria bacterium]|nr:hypothetical protein [Gammaproteobacteria bacterium]
MKSPISVIPVAIIAITIGFTVGWSFPRQDNTRPNVTRIMESNRTDKLQRIDQDLASTHLKTHSDMAVSSVNTTVQWLSFREHAGLVKRYAVFREPGMAVTSLILDQSACREMPGEHDTESPDSSFDELRHSIDDVRGSFDGIAEPDITRPFKSTILIF